jgi:hypothetical protein
MPNKKKKPIDITGTENAKMAPEKSKADKSVELVPRVDYLKTFVNTDPQNWSNTQAREALAIALEVLLLRDVQE